MGSTGWKKWHFSCWLTGPPTFVFAFDSFMKFWAWRKIWMGNETAGELSRWLNKAVYLSMQLMSFENGMQWNNLKISLFKNRWRFITPFCDLFCSSEFSAILWQITHLQRQNLRISFEFWLDAPKTKCIFWKTWEVLHMQRGKRTKEDCIFWAQKHNSDVCVLLSKRRRGKKENKSGNDSL